MKKNLILFSMLGICFFANARQTNDTFTIKGDVEGLKTTYLYTLGFPKRDSIAVKDGHFSYTGSGLKAPVQVTLSDKKTFHLVLYLEHGTTYIKGNAVAPDEI